MDISELKYDINGLIPAIVVDSNTNEVLMLAYMNEESLRISIDEGKTCFWSRSRNELWRKGATSGNEQIIESIRTDCDKDTLIVAVKAKGPACHTGARTCFFNTIMPKMPDEPTQNIENAPPPFTLDTLYNIIKDRKENPKPGSYTNYLFEKGKDKILKKIGEESTEVIIAAKSGDKPETIYELADLVYHAMVLMAEMGITNADVMGELESRFNKRNN
jgi:phosphoribosyl-ATP pyrophosphohydrolase/phosphoribosyl-AMP cyclohydrolase